MLLSKGTMACVIVGIAKTFSTKRVNIVEIKAVAKNFCKNIFDIARFSEVTVSFQLK